MLASVPLTDPVLAALPRFGFSADADMQGDHRQARWAGERARYGFDETDLWSYDAVFMRVLRHLLPEMRGISEADMAAIEAMLDLYARDANCSPLPAVQLDLACGHDALYRALWDARLPSGVRLAQPLARHALPRLQQFTLHLAGQHGKPQVRRKRAIHRIIRALRLVESQPLEQCSFRQRLIFFRGMRQFLRLLPSLWT